VKLEGSLDAFGLPDIFQLLSLTKKTGGLHLRSGASVGVVHFADGAVTGADADLARQTLARRLVGTGTVSDEALVAAVKRARADGIGVGRALLDAGAVDPDLLRDAAADVAYDAVFDLLRWPEGDFAFSPEAVNPDDVGIHMPTDQVVAQAWTRQQGLDSASDVIDSAELVLTMPAILSVEPDLSRAEWSLVALADGHRTVGEIVDLTGQSYYTVVQNLAGLVRKGLLRVPGDAPDHVATVLRRLDLVATLEGAVADPRASVAPPTPATTGSAVHVPAPPPRTAPMASAPLHASAAAPGSLTALVPEPAMTTQRTQTVAPERVVATAPAASLGEPVEPSEPSEPGERREPGEASEVPAPELVSTVGGPHVPEGVLPPRPEPFLARRQPDHPEVDPPAVAGRAGFGPGTAVAAARTSTSSVFSQPTGGPSEPAATGGAGGAGMAGNIGGMNGSAAIAVDPDIAALIERDPSVNRSLLLRLIAGVRGL
jgi:Domain of unknown function (DUF4388)